MEHMKAPVPLATIVVAVGCRSTHFPDPYGLVIDVHAKQCRVETSTEAVILSVPSIGRGTRTNPAGAAIATCDPRR
jgi:hypothetical protein